MTGFRIYFLIPAMLRWRQCMKPVPILVSALNAAVDPTAPIGGTPKKEYQNGQQGCIAAQSCKTH